MSPFLRRLNGDKSERTESTLLIQMPSVYRRFNDGLLRYHQRNTGESVNPKGKMSWLT